MKTFPMFLKMADRRVLIIGGGEQAAQKARLILKTEAEICVVAEELNTELQSYVSEARVRHLTGPVTVELLASAILVFSATGCAGAGAAHAALAKEANAMINVVDMPAHCEAMTPSIVDRDPLVIAIGTEGNAPILGRKIKSMIEGRLAPGLGRLVAFAGRMRPTVAQKVPQEERRDFWHWVFAEQPRKDFELGRERKAFSLISERINGIGKGTRKMGSLHLVATKDQDPDHLTLRDVRHLQDADTIFFERGQTDAILEFARRDARRVAVEPGQQNGRNFAGIVEKARNEGDNIVVLSCIELAIETPATHFH